MVAEHCTQEEFIAYFERLGAQGTADVLNMSVRNVHKRRARIEEGLGRLLKSPAPNSPRHQGLDHPARIRIEVYDGIVLVGSDAHYWPGITSTAHRAFCHLAKALKPSLIVMNGDVVDGAKISRHPPMGWEELPKFNEELDAAKERLAEIKRAAPRGCHFTWPLGNHDARMEMMLAKAAPDMEGIQGAHLKDHFDPCWIPCWATWINDDVVIKHRFKGGIHASHNNTLWAGKTMVTGHLHSLKVTPFTDYTGTRYGVDTGTLADPMGPQFEYGEDNPKNHRSGFVVLTFHEGMLLWPEICAVVDRDHVQFRGQVIEV